MDLIPSQQLCLLLESMTPQLHTIGFELAEGLMGNEGQFMYPFTSVGGVQCFGIVLKRTGAENNQDVETRKA